MGNVPKPDEESKYLLPEDWKKFKAAVDDPILRTMFDLSQCCGLRLNEALSLTKEKFDFPRGIVYVRTLKRKGNPVFPLDVRPDLMETIKELCSNKSKDYRPFNYIPMTVWRRFKKAIKKAKLNERLSPHSLRHLCGLKLVKATGGNIIEIAKHLRHASSLSSEHYVHLSPIRRKEISESMWEMEE